MRIISGKSDEFFDEGVQFAAAHGADVLINELTVFVDENRGDAADAVGAAYSAVLIDVELADQRLAVVGVGSGVKRRSQQAARAAPGRPKVDENGLVACRVKSALERGVGNVNDFFTHGSCS